jgi:hypothetical protein
MQISNCSTLDPRHHRRRTIPFSGLSLHPKNVTAAGQVRCFRRTRSNPQTSRITLPVTVQLQSNRHHLAFRMRIDRLPTRRSTVCLCQRRLFADRHDWRSPPSQQFAGYRTNDQAAAWRRPTDSPTERWQDKSREARRGRLAGKRAMIKDLAQCAPAHESLPDRASHCKYRQERTSRSDRDDTRR